MVAEIFGGVSAFKAMFDMAKSVNEMADTAKRDRLAIELQKQILSAQASQFALVEEVSALKAKISSLEKWDAEKQRYQLEDVGNGALAYVAKQDMRGLEPPHQICASCYQRGLKSILQPLTKGMDKYMFCPECKTELKIGFHDWPAPSALQKRKNHY